MPKALSGICETDCNYLNSLSRISIQGSFTRNTSSLWIQVFTNKSFTDMSRCFLNVKRRVRFTWYKQGEMSSLQVLRILQMFVPCHKTLGDAIVTRSNTKYRVISPLLTPKKLIKNKFKRNSCPKRFKTSFTWAFYQNSVPVWQSDCIIVRYVRISQKRKRDILWGVDLRAANTSVTTYKPQTILQQTHTRFTTQSVSSFRDWNIFIF